MKRALTFSQTFLSKQHILFSQSFLMVFETLLHQPPSSAYVLVILNSPIFFLMNLCQPKSPPSCSSVIDFLETKCKTLLFFCVKVPTINI